MFVKLRRLAAALGLIATILGLIACGGRSELFPGDSGPPAIACKQDGDCFDGNLCTTKACVAGYCSTLATKTCDEQNICTSDSCDPGSGNCVFASLVHDNDHDGVNGPLPGTVA